VPRAFQVSETECGPVGCGLGLTTSIRIHPAAKICLYSMQLTKPIWELGQQHPRHWSTRFTTVVVMESGQPPSKRTRTQSASSASSHPTKTVKTESHPAADGDHHPEQTLEQTDDSGPSDTSQTQLVPHHDQDSQSPPPEPSAGKSETIQSTNSRETSEAGWQAPHPTASTSRASAAETVPQSEPKAEDPKPIVYSNGDWEAVYDTEYVNFLS
jgi:hypothetical protein